MSTGSPPQTTSSAEDAAQASLNPNVPPKPSVPPGHTGPVRTPHPHDVLSGRGGRINSHPGNVRFREKVDAHKREYLDPRTKKAAKARIAARIVQQIRALDPPGRFLKEDPHTGLWVEIGDERAWKKAGQALRESAPEIRAERQAQLQLLASGASLGQVEGVLAHSGSRGGRKKAADPPGPRHRPNPPEREGLARNFGEAELDPQSQQLVDSDPELLRMRQEYYAMQRMQQEQQRRMLQYQEQLRNSQGSTGGGGVNATLDGPFSDSYERNIYDEYNQMQRNVQMGGGNRGQAQPDLQQSGNSNNMRSESSLLASEIMNEGLLPVDAGFVIPALRNDGSQQPQLSPQEMEQMRRYQQRMQQQQAQPTPQAYHQQQQGLAAQEVFGGNPFHSCDKSVSTMASFDIHSMDMSSMGGFSWNQSGMMTNPHNASYNQSMISTGSANASQGRYGTTFASSPQSKKKASAGGMSALERKLEKVNEAHRQQKQRQAMVLLAQQQALLTGGGDANVSVPTAQGPKEGSKSYKDHMQSQNSFGFEAIEEDDITHSSYKMSHLGLSEMDMTFASEKDLLSVRSKSAPKSRATGEAETETANRRASNDGTQRHKSDGDEDAPAPEGVSAADVFGSHSSGSHSSEHRNRRRMNMSMEDFNESFKSMDVSEDRRSRGKKKADPDGAAGGGRYGGGGGSNRGRRDPGGRGGLQTIPSARTVAASNPANASGMGERRKSSESLSDPDLLHHALASADFEKSTDFGVSLNSLKSFQSTGTEGSSWINQYNSMENVHAGRSAWEDEEEESHGNSIASEISAPRMITATGGGD
ncbi:hypothetical protein ACHAXT_002727 [Thalassiosira profunda]